MGRVSALDMDDSMIAEKNDVWWSVKFWGRIRYKIDRVIILFSLLRLLL